MMDLEQVRASTGRGPSIIVHAAYMDYRPTRWPRLPRTVFASACLLSRSCCCRLPSWLSSLWFRLDLHCSPALSHFPCRTLRLRPGAMPQTVHLHKEKLVKANKHAVAASLYWHELCAPRANCAPAPSASVHHKQYARIGRRVLCEHDSLRARGQA